MTRCKVGNLAFVVKSRSGKTIGLICTVICSASFDEDGYNWMVDFGKAVPGTNGVGETVYKDRMVAPDEWLRPIRDNPSEDETLTWAPVPHKEIA